MGLVRAAFFYTWEDTDKKIVTKLSVKPELCELQINMSPISKGETLTVVWLYDIHKLYGSCLNSLSWTSSFRRGLLTKLTVRTEPYDTNIDTGHAHEHKGVDCSALWRIEASGESIEGNQPSTGLYIIIYFSIFILLLSQIWDRQFKTLFLIIYFWTFCFAMYECVIQCISMG